MEKQRLLLTGANGFLAGRMAARWADSYEIIPFTRAQADFTNAAQTLAAMEAAAPHVVLHCAAVSDTALAQSEPALSYAVNVTGALHVAQACLSTGARLVYCSSDQVYNGCAPLHPLDETIPLAPETVYAQHKLEAEQAVQALLPDAVALRLTWLYDLPQQGQKAGSNLLCNLLRAALAGQSLAFPVRQLRGVTWVQELVEQLPSLLALPGGVYNAGCTSGPEETAYEVAAFAAKALGASCPEALVEPDLLRFKEHVSNLNMDTHKIGTYGVSFLPTLKGIEACLRAYGWQVGEPR